MKHRIRFGRTLKVFIPPGVPAKDSEKGNKVAGRRQAKVQNQGLLAGENQP